MKPTLKKILVPTDFSRCADAAFRQGHMLARHFGADLIYLHVDDRVDSGDLRPLAPPSTDFESDCRGLKVQAHVVRIEHPDPVKAILEVARSEQVDLIVIGAHGDRGARLLLNQGVERSFLGRTSEQVVRHAPCSVLKVGIGGEGAAGKVDNILLALEEDDPTEEAFEWTAELAKACGSRIEVLQVLKLGSPSSFKTLGADVSLETVRKKLLSRTGLPEHFVGTTLARGNPARVIRSTVRSRSCDLIIQESHSRFETALLGETAAEVARTVQAAVLTLRSATGQRMDLTNAAMRQ